MYSPWVIRASTKKLEDAYSTTLREYSPQECAEWTARLRTAVDDHGRPARALHKEEQQFIQNELLMCKASFPHWAQRYMTINTKRAETQKLYPLLDSQKFVLGRIADFERAPDRYDGILLNVLKAKRQVGITTLFEGMIAHRVTTQDNVNALLASDTPANSGGLFTMQKTIIGNLPWWLRPAVTDDVKNAEVVFDGGSRVWIHSGKSMTGVEGNRGQIGRSRTVHAAHLSELSSWEWPDQIDDSLMEAIPENPRVFVGIETTAQGRNTWMHQHWLATADGHTRFRNLFIPWYAEASFSRPVPPDWAPKQETLEHAKRIEATSEKWMGYVYTPTREQLYWWESKRAEFEAKDNLRGFLQEVGSIDDDECFQSGGSEVLGTKALDRLQQFVRPPVVMLDVLAMQSGMPLGHVE